MDHRVQYLKDENGHYVGCVAIREHTAHVSDHYSVIEYRVSVRNPQDRFDKDVARQLALGRMVEEPFEVRVSARPNMYEISAAVMKDIVEDSSAPSRARRCARVWLRKNAP